MLEIGTRATFDFIVCEIKYAFFMHMDENHFGNKVEKKMLVSQAQFPY